jgi:ELWxxDGT repeat protein
MDMNGTLFFAADDGVHGYELWKSDGTAAGTTLVKDIRPGGYLSYGDYHPFSSNPSNLTNVNGTLIFTADDGNGNELWKSDGTAAGTTVVKDIYPGSSYYYDYWGNLHSVPNSSSPQELRDVNGTLYFSANDGENGYELWKSDGTADGTVLVKDIRPGANGAFPNSLMNVNGTLFFGANDGVHGKELWKSDGTAAGTVLVKDIRPGTSDSYPSFLTNVNGTLYFSASDGTIGKELWKSDGSAAGTVMVKDITTGSASSSPVNLLNVNGTLFFTADDGTHGRELWKSDGTTAGTVMVKDMNPGSASSLPSQLTSVNGTLFFSARDGTGVLKLWQSDGSAAGTILIANFLPLSLISFNGTLFFSADDGIHGYELWKLVNSAPTVAAATIGDGTAQRSQVASLTVTFSAQVTFAETVASAFTLTRNGGGAVNFSATASVIGGVTVVTLTGFTGSETQFGSLKDGRYTLTALASQISANGQQMASDYTFGDAQGLFRFYGDINGDRHVDIADFGQFSSTFNLSTGQTGFLAAFDFNGDWVIDIADFGQFSIRMFTVLP